MNHVIGQRGDSDGTILTVWDDVTNTIKLVKVLDTSKDKQSTVLT